MADIKAIFLKNKDDIIKPITVLLAICIVIALALSLTNKITADKIAGLEAENQQKTMAELIEADEFYLKTASDENGKNKFEFYAAIKDDTAVGYIFMTSAKGYGGDISVMTAVNPDGSVKSIAILDASNETPGLGQNVTKEDFYSRYNGRTKNITVVKSGAVAENNEIDAVTGATISSKAVTEAVNEALKNFEYAENQLLNMPETEVADSE